MEKYDKKIAMVEQKTNYIRYIYCDRCKKLLYKRYCDGFEQLEKQEKLEETDYYHVFMGHNDWGNDSCESYEYKDFCIDCIKEEFNEYIERSKENSNTEFFEINHEYGLTVID